MTRLPNNWPAYFPYAPWYLDAVSGDWDFVQAEDEHGNITGVLPFQLTRKFGLPILTPPPLCPRLGPVIYYPPSLKRKDKKAFEIKILSQLVKQLPKVIHAKINWPYHLESTDCWENLGWKTKRRHSYVLCLDQALDLIWKGFKSSLRNKIRKGERILQVNETQDWQIPFTLTQKSFKHRGTKEQLQSSMFAKLDEATQKNKSRKIFIARDTFGRPHAAIWLFYDQECAYNLLLGSDPSLRQSGAVPLLLWYAIQWSKTNDLKEFDFEGSQIPGVESFFRSFGGEARPYYQLTKTNKWLEVLKKFG